MENKIRLDVQAFLSTIQLCVTDTAESEDIKAFGSGFYLLHKERLFFITADHLVHLYDHDSTNDTGQRLGIDMIPQIITNRRVPGEAASVMIPTGGYYHLTGFKINEEDFESKSAQVNALRKVLDDRIDINDETLPIDTRIANMLDVAITEIKKPMECFPLSNRVKDFNNDTIIEEGHPKQVLYSSQQEIDSKHTYIVAGTIKNEIVNSCVINRLNVCHAYLKFDAFNEDGDACMLTSEEPAIENWEGLSGAPVFNDEGVLVGMLLRGPVTEPIITVMPIQKIIRLIDQIIVVNACSQK